MFNLVVEDVTKTFREGRETVSVLKGATLRVAPGEVLALEGPSGSGKTTLLSIAGCLLSATSGKVEIAGSAVDASRSASLQAVRRRHIGFVFQQFNLFPALSALENVEYALNLKGVLDDAATDQARELIERVGLADRARFLPRDLSGGQKQRVAIARALAASPSLVLADEPTANLDASVAEQILDLFRELARSEGRSLLIVTHDPKVRRVADRVVRIEAGRIAA
ncbi:MAG TPA: ABC transporter ATP-binding protein [Polyangiaceae bacterium]|nr:ABC transporter ATP-binding protein [Polyangiaceae bacterium]